jgi:nitrate reductase alpha subunit
MAMGHVILKEFYFDKRAPTSRLRRRYTDLPVLVLLKERMPRRRCQPDRFLRASDLTGNLGQDNNPEWKTIALDASGELVRQGSIGFAGARRASGTSCLEAKARDRPQLGLIGDDVAEVAFPYFGGDARALPARGRRCRAAAACRCAA